MASEFDLIRRYFTRAPRHTALGVGDDAALIRPAAGMELVVSCDMLVEGTHFFPNVEPRALGWKTLAVNLSDIAAMGATPRWALLSMALPAADEAWIASFAQGLIECCEAFDVDLIGGDTTRGPLNLSITILGEVPQGQALLRSGARPGHDIWISGWPGRAALGLRYLQGQLVLSSPQACLEALHWPQPRVALGLALRGTASAALDVSDGLLGDLAHILERSGTGATLEDARLPLAALAAHTEDLAAARACLLSGGDDYELLFCAEPARRAEIEALATRLDLPLARIGRITAEPGLRLIDAAGQPLLIGRFGFDHFANQSASS